MTVMMMVNNYVSTPLRFHQALQWRLHYLYADAPCMVYYIWMMFGVNVDEYSSTMVRIWV